MTSESSPVKKRGCWFWVLMIFVLGAGAVLAAIIVIFGLYILVPDNINSKPGADSSSGVVERMPPPELEPIAALKLLYPGQAIEYGHITRRATIPGMENEEEVPPEERVGTVWTSVDSVVPFFQSGHDKVFVVLATLPPLEGQAQDYPHATSPGLGLAQLVFDSGSWRIEARSDDLGEVGGGYGAMPDGRLIQFGSNSFGYLLDSSYTGQGYTVSDSEIYAPVPDGNFIQIAEIPTVRSNDGVGLDADQTYGFETDLSVDMSNETAASYPVEIKRHGSCKTPLGNIKKIEHTVIYLYDVRQQQLLGADPVHSECDLTL